MKQQFEVGDKAILDNESVVEVIAIDMSSGLSHKVRFLCGNTEWVSKANLSETGPSTTPTTTVTVHGNPEWKPEKGEQIGWKIIKWFPMRKVQYKVLNDNQNEKGYCFEVESLYEDEFMPMNHPDFFAPVYKEAKPIEFVKGVNIINETLEVLGCMPPEAKTIHLLCKDYRETGWDLMFVEFDGTAPLLYLGHFNSGTI